MLDLIAVVRIRASPGDHLFRSSCGSDRPESDGSRLSRDFVPPICRLRQLVSESNEGNIVAPRYLEQESQPCFRHFYRLRYIIYDASDISMKLKLNISDYCDMFAVSCCPIGFQTFQTFASRNV